jgi:hypothetical protein
MPSRHHFEVVFPERGRDMEKENQYIQVLAIMNFIYGGISFLVSCLPIFHFLMGIAMLTGALPTDGRSADDAFPLMLFGWMFTIIAAAIILLGWLFSINLIIAGYFLQRRRHFLYCMVMAGICCLSMPFGTILGVLTIILLVNTSVKSQFA